VTQTSDFSSRFTGDIVAAARALIGATLLVDGVGGIIVETEAYHAEEPASHSFRGPTPRNGAMYLGPGHAYVYRSYGIHWCLNFTGPPGTAVLIRAVAPEVGLAAMRHRRGLEDLRTLASGPGKLCAALGIDLTHNGSRLDHPPFDLALPSVAPDLVIGPRIGITKAVDLPWRFGLAGSPFLSRPFPRLTGKSATKPA
jgi:DNA-3-methyladenine glycosylase